MGFENLTIEEIFGKLHTQECKKLFNHYIILTKDIGDYEYYPVLTDSTVCYGTDNFELFKKALNEVFKQEEIDQLLTQKISVMLDASVGFFSSGLDTAISYLKKDKKGNLVKNTLFLNSYPKEEFEETKEYYMSKSPLNRFRF